MDYAVCGKGKVMSLAKAQKEYDNRTPPEYEEHCEECGYGRCKCDEIERGDEMRDRWKDEVKGR